MSARTRLNDAYRNGCLIVSALLGLVTGSWAVFLIGLAIMTSGGFYNGEIRPTSGRR